MDTAFPAHSTKQNKYKAPERPSPLASREPVVEQTMQDFVFLVFAFLSFGVLYMFSDQRRLPHSKLSSFYDMFDYFIQKGQTRGTPDPHKQILFRTNRIPLLESTDTD